LWYGGVCEEGVEEDFGLKKEEVAGACRQLHIEVLHDLYCSSNIGVIK
jgi:hypothetical protein